MASNDRPVFDVAVIGGGAIGLACAWKIASRGARVVLFDRAQSGREASHAAGGMLAPACENAVHPWNCSPLARAAMLKFCIESRDFYPDFASQLLEETGVDVELSLRGAASDWREPGILFVPPDSEPNGEDVRFDARLDHGLEATWREKTAVFFPDDGQVDSRKLIDALRAAAQGKGVEFRENCTVRRLIMENGRVAGVSDDKTEVRADKVLLCAGAWSGKIGELPPEISQAVRPLAGEMVQLRGERRVRHVIYSDDCYLVPRRDGRLLVGATVEEVGFNKRVTAGGVGKLLMAACALVPELCDAPLESHWAGLRPATPDGLPLLGHTPIENLFVATGHGRNGVLLTPATSQTIAELVLENRANSDISDHFSPSRFAGARLNSK